MRVCDARAVHYTWNSIMFRRQNLEYVEIKIKNFAGTVHDYWTYEFLCYIIWIDTESDERIYRDVKVFAKKHQIIMTTAVRTPFSDQKFASFSSIPKFINSIKICFSRSILAFLKGFFSRKLILLNTKYWKSWLFSTT